jgi:hypothetical protein
VLKADIDFGDAQDIQVLQDKLSLGLYYLTINRNVIHEVQKQRTYSRDDENAHDSAIKHLAESMVAEANMELARLDCIIKRAKETQKLVSCSFVLI